MYQHFAEQVKGDGDPACFSSLSDTGVPELQEWCKSLTSSSRERGARNLRRQLRVFATNIKTYVEGFGAVSEEDRESLREQWQTKRVDSLVTMGEVGTDGGRTDDDNDDDPYSLGNLKKTVNQAYDLPRDDEEVEGVSMRLANVSQTA